MTGQPVRSVVVDGEPWFVAADVAAVLDLGNPRSSLALLDDDEKGVHGMDTLGGVQQMTTVNEPGLYSLILRSRKPEARAFKRWMTHDVLPAIRLTGAYSTARPMTELEAAHRYVAALEREQLLTATVAELEPSAHAWEALASAEGDYSVREAAQVLDRDPHISTGQNRLFATLRELRWIDADGRPYQAQVDAGRLVRRPTSYTHPHSHEPVLTSQVRITAKGLRELHKRLSGSAALPRGRWAA